MALAQAPIYIRQVQPDYERFRRFLIRKRIEGGFDTTTKLRHSVGSVAGVTARTLTNVEESGRCELTTFLYLPEFYKVGYFELLSQLMPGLRERHERASDLMASLPWLSETTEALAKAPEAIQGFVRAGLNTSEKGVAVSPAGERGGNDDAFGRRL